MGTYSKLHDLAYRKIRNNFPTLRIRENIRPEWLLSEDLTRLELDLFIEQMHTAIEIQGEQHYRYVPHFHGNWQGWINQQKRDEQKRNLCFGHGVRLIEIACEMDLNIFINEMQMDWKDYHFTPQGIPTEEVPLKKPKKSIMRSKRFREWLRKKRLRKLGVLPPAVHPVEKAGSQKMRQRAKRILKSDKINESLWVVTGGREPHRIKMGELGYLCDCVPFSEGKRICSHIMRVMVDAGELTI